jgi:hypothetical protein
MCTVLLPPGANPIAVNKCIYLLIYYSSVGIATDYRLDGLGSNPGGDEFFPPVQTGPGTYAASCKMGTGSFPGVKCGRGVLLTTHPPSSAAVMEE